MRPCDFDGRRGYQEKQEVSLMEQIGRVPEGVLVKKKVLHTGGIWKEKTASEEISGGLGRPNSQMHSLVWD